jgi:hypothetical protein
MSINKVENSLQSSVACKPNIDDDVEFIVQHFNRKRRASVRQPEKSKIVVKEQILELKEIKEESEPIKESDKLIFLDWDDTLLCGTLCGLKEKPDEEYIATLIQLIRLLKTFGRICIVTNAEQGWVQHSGNKYIPEVMPELNDIQIFSAQSYFKVLSESPEEWKRYAFEHLILGQQTKPKIIMSIGDANYERNAVKKASCNLAIENLVSIKLNPQPSCADITSQYKFLMPQFKTLLDSKGHYDYMVNALS